MSKPTEYLNPMSCCTSNSVPELKFFALVYDRFRACWLVWGPAHGVSHLCGFLFQAEPCFTRPYHVRTRQKSGCLDTRPSGCRNNTLSEFNRAHGDSQGLEQSSSIKWLFLCLSPWGKERERLGNKRPWLVTSMFWWVTSVPSLGCSLWKVVFPCFMWSQHRRTDRAWWDLGKHLFREHIII